MPLNPWTDSRLKSEINVTSLADVTLSLLLMFLVITPIIFYSFSADLPQVGAGVGAAKTAQEVVVTVTDDNQVKINGREVDEQGLAEELETLFSVASTEDRKVVFEGGKQASYEKVVRVMDLLREHGVVAIGVR